MNGEILWFEKRINKIHCVYLNPLLHLQMFVSNIFVIAFIYNLQPYLIWYAVLFCIFIYWYFWNHNMPTNLSRFITLLITHK